MSQMAKSKTPLSQIIEPKRSFAPITASDARILILGSLPGDRSLELQQYYGHAQNRFWKILAAIFKTDVPATYEEKVQLLADNKVALWDVAHNAIRHGSLDSAIRDVEPNDIDRLLETHPEIRTIAFNGQKAEAMFNKFFNRREGIKYVTLPSSSPANAGRNLTSLIDEWQNALQ